jgi:PhoH-like ATPase
MEKIMKKTFILDTNALIYNARAIYHFGNNDVIIPFVVLEEIDRLKTKPEKVGESARKVNREIEKLRVLAKQQNSNLSSGVILDNGGRFMIWAPAVSVPNFLDKEKADNVIISTALEIKTRRPNEEIIVVSKDINVRIKCDAMGLVVEDFNDHLDVEEIYDGTAPDMYIEEYMSVRLHAGEKVPVSEVLDAVIDGTMPEFELFPNMYAKLLGPVGPNSTKNPSVLVKFKESEQHGYLVEKIREHKMWGVAGQNVEQRYAIDALMDPSVSLVTLSGFAGTGKTLCAIAAALEQTDLFGKNKAGGTITKKSSGSSGKSYSRIMISRPLEPFHKEIGFLPGNLNEKMAPWLSPLWDNMEFLFRNANQGKQEIEAFVESGVIEIRALTHIRGSSIANSFIIIDECQNLTKHELKTILTRVGNGSKLVLTGDVEQIDNPHLDKLNSGLAIVIELFKDAGITSHVTLKKGLRSELATLAIKKFE